jgi:hypothetical protein
MKYKKPDFVAEKRFDIGQCSSKGEPDFCNGKYNEFRCPVKTAFFGLIAYGDGWKNYEVRPVDDTCPEYVEWGLNFEGKEEYVAITDGGQLSGFKPKGKGPCFFMTMKFTNPELMKIMSDLFSLVPEGNDAIIDRYLIGELGASKDIGDKIIKIASSYNRPRFKN